MSREHEQKKPRRHHKLLLVRAFVAFYSLLFTGIDQCPSGNAGHSLPVERPAAHRTKASGKKGLREGRTNFWMGINQAAVVANKSHLRDAVVRQLTHKKQLLSTVFACPFLRDCSTRCGSAIWYSQAFESDKQLSKGHARLSNSSVSLNF